LAEKKERKGSAAVYILTALCMILLCCAAAFAAAIVPYEKFKTYLDLAFMDDMKITPSNGLTGLVIKENTEIATEAPSGQQFSDTGEIIRPAFGEQYAVLECKSASIRVPVYWGSSEELLERGACQSSSSNVIGEVGNAVIDAHVNTFFANLNKIKEGDEVILYTSYGIFTYKVRECVTFENTNKKYVLPTETEQLTLYTCQAQVLGTSTTRIGVLCDVVSKQFYTGEGAAE
jgi:sortase A